MFSSVMLLLVWGNTVLAKEPGLDFYHVERFARNIDTEGHYAKRFRLCNLRFGEYEIPFFLDFVSDPKVNGMLGAFWKVSLLESRLVPAGKGKMTFVSVTGQRFQFDLPKKGEESEHSALRYEAKGNDAELTLLTGDEENIFHFRDNRLVRWEIHSGSERVSLDFRRNKEVFSIVSSQEADPMFQLVPLSDDEGKGFRMEAAGQTFDFTLEENVTLFGEELGPVSMLSSIACSEGKHVGFRYHGFDMRTAELMATADQLEVYEMFHPPPKRKNKQKVEKPLHYASVKSEGELLDLNLTWEMRTGFPALSGNELCLVEGSIDKWRVSTSLCLLRSFANSARWERRSMDWKSGQRTYVDSSGYEMVEDIILTPGNSYEKTRSGSSVVPGEGDFSYRVLYDRNGNKIGAQITRKGKENGK